MRLGQDRQGIGADLVGRIAVFGDPVGTYDDLVDFSPEH